MEWVYVAIVGAIILLFGSKKLPEMARGLGQSMRIIKSETRGLTEDEEKAKAPKPGEAAPGRAVEGESATGSGTSSEKARDTTPGT